MSTTFNENVVMDGALSVGGVATHADDIAFSANKVIRRSTSDGSDSGVVQVAGGGAAGNTRGADVALYGNEHASNAGDAVVTLGDVSGAQFRVSNGGDVLTIEEGDGSATFISSNASNAWNLTSSAANGSYLKIQRSVNGYLLVGNAEAIDAALGTNDDSAIKASAQLFLEAGSGVWSNEIYSETNAAAANLVVLSDGHILRSTSSARYKTNIKPLENWKFLLDIEPVTFDEKSSGRHFIGLTAENVAAVEPRLAVMDSTGRPDEVAYSHLAAPIIKAIQDLHQQLSTAHETITSLTNRLERLEAARA